MMEMTDAIIAHKQAYLLKPVLLSPLPSSIEAYLTSLPLYYSVQFVSQFLVNTTISYIYINK